MKLLDYLKIIYHCFFSRKLYRYVFSAWGGNIFVYLLLASFVISIIPAYSFVAVQFKIDTKEIMAEKTNDSFNANIATIIEQLPELNFKDNQLSFNNANNQQVVIIRDLSGKEIITIDPNDQITNNNSKYIFHKNTVNIIGVNGETNKVTYSSFLPSGDKIVINKEYILHALSLMESYKYIFLMFVILFATFFLAFNSCFYAVFYALVLVMLRYRGEFSSKMTPMIRVMIVASTPSSIFRAIEVVIANNFIITAQTGNLLPILVSASSIIYAIYASQSLLEKPNLKKE